MKQIQIIYLVPTQESADQLKDILEHQAEFKGIKIFTREWKPISFVVEAETDENTARKMALFLQKFLGYA